MTDPQAPLTRLVELLRCLSCEAPLTISELVEPREGSHLGPDGTLRCRRCDREYPLVAGTVRTVQGGEDGAGDGGGPRGAEWEAKRQTGEAFAYEWKRFGMPREHWSRNFREYVQPHPPEFFRGKLVLDVGTGSGRHSLEAARLGAGVVAVDLGDAIDTARRNLPPDVLTVQADAESLPLARRRSTS